MEKKKRLSRFWIFIIVYAGIALLLNVLALWQGFCDFYTDRLFWLSSAIYSRITGLFPFSVGEVLIALLVPVLLAALVLAVCMIFLRKRKRFMHFCNRYYKVLLTLALTVVMLMTLNCTILYRCSKLEVNGNGDKTYTYEDVVKLRNFIVEQCNELAEQVPRDESGYMAYDEQLDEKVVDALHAISGEYPRMAGYYPDAKAMFGSYFMYQSHTLGVYFPFTMEANYNKYISESVRAATIAHELSHLKGYIYENEANFIAFIACTASEDTAVQYSGYLSVLDYVENDAADYVDASADVQVSELVQRDNVIYTYETREALEAEEPVIDSEIVHSISDTFTQSYLDYYNAEANYAEVTQLLLQYYDGKL